jgi:Tfp pilus assembly protein PilZ
MSGLEEELGSEGITIQLIRRILDMPYDRQVSLLMQLDDASLTGLETADRDEKRKNFTSNVSFTVQGVDYTGVSEDISAGGMFIRTDESFILGQTMVLTILYTNRKKQAKIPAEIVRVKEGGIGVRFLKKSET